MSWRCASQERMSGETDASFLIQRRFRVRVDEQAFDDGQDLQRQREPDVGRRTCSTPYSGFQSFFKVLTQISPDEGATFGWKILVTNQHLGGDAGKPDANSKRILK